eukprot:g4452.t1
MCSRVSYRSGTQSRASIGHEWTRSSNSIHQSRGLKSTNRLSSTSSSFCRDLFLRSKIEQPFGALSSRRNVFCPSAGMNLVFISAEVTPWSKTGGLGDVVGGLPIELAKLGHKVMTIAPRYDQYSDCWDTSITIQTSCGAEVRFFHARKKGVDRVFIDNPCFLAKVWGKTGSRLYGEKSGADYKDNQKRFRMFCEAAIEATRTLPFSPGENCTIIANDWHSGLVPVLLKDVYQPRGEFRNTKCIFCVHNIAFQGRFWQQDFSLLRLPESSKYRFEFVDGYPIVFDEDSPADDDIPKQESVRAYKKINWMRAAFTAADKVITVSPNYAKEIVSGADRGVELDDVLRQVGVEGIVNGMDPTDWDPSTDKFLDVNYDRSSVEEGKALAKESLQGEAGLPIDPKVPLFGFIGRLEEQKGVDILIKALPKAMKQTNVQLVILGTGKKKFERSLKTLETKYPDHAKGIARFSPRLAHLITAGADFMLVPSRFEPCGLIQLQAMHYGTVPVVSTTGGLVDTVKEGVTGLHIGPLDQNDLLEKDADAIAKTMMRAAKVFETPKYLQMVHACIDQDLTWKKPAKKWEAVIEELNNADTSSATAKKSSISTPVMDA